MTITGIKSKRRDKLSIMADIIEIAKESTLKTQIMYQANLSFTQLNDYLAFMLINNLIAPSMYEGREGYKVTERGLDFSQKHSELIRILKTPNGSRKT